MDTHASYLFFYTCFARRGRKNMFLMIDNYDSFVYNLKAYFEELGREIMVRRSDQINIEEIEKMQPEGIILSPGPKRPWMLCDV